MDLAAIQVQRAEEQMVDVLRESTRIDCLCGCGRWWYVEAQTGAGRHLLLATPECKRRRINRMRYLQRHGFLAPRKYRKAKD